MNWFVGNVGGITDGPFISKQSAEKVAAGHCGAGPFSDPDKTGKLEVTKLNAGFYTLQSYDKELSLQYEVCIFTKNGGIAQGFKPAEF